MVQIHMTQAEVVKNFAAALEKVKQGLEIVVENDHEAVAVLRSAVPPRRKISEVLTRMPKYSYAKMDADFARDVETRGRKPPGIFGPIGVGLILDSSVVIAAERLEQAAYQMLEAISPAEKGSRNRHLGRNRAGIRTRHHPR